MFEPTDFKILVACHNDSTFIRREEPYLPIQVGKNLHPDVDLGFISDNTGDNISGKNASYCELTALYWGWKNLTNVSVKGLAHYRRYLKITPEQIAKYLKEYDLIVPSLIPRPWNVAIELTIWTSLEDTYRLIDILKAKHPKHSLEIDDYFLNNNRFSRLNMLIAPAKVYDEYCEFLFDVLAEFEKGYKPYHFSRQRRIMGYLAEPLLGLWLKITCKKAKGVRLDDHADNSFHTRFLEWRYNRAYHLYQGLLHKSKPYYYPAVISALRADGFALSQLPTSKQ